MQLGQLLINQGALNEAQVRDALARFAEVQSPKSEQLFESIGSLPTPAAARYLVDSFPKMTMRLSQIHVKVSQGQEAAEKPINDYTASIALDGPGGVCVSLSSDKQFARRIMDGMTRIMAGDANLGYGDNKDDEDLLGGFPRYHCGASSRCFREIRSVVENGHPNLRYTASRTVTPLNCKQPTVKPRSFSQPLPEYLSKFERNSSMLFSKPINGSPRNLS